SDGVLNPDKGPVLFGPDREDPRLADRHKFWQLLGAA
ncbi:universal stress protein, partial [Paenarthrobacter aurescens]|nr:universal stress protein [Paenarthrobacter aurescens]